MWSSAKGISRLDLVGVRPDRRLDPEVVEQVHDPGVELGDRHRPEREAPRAAVAAADFEPVADEIELDLESAGAIGDGRCRQAARADVQRHLPPMVEQGSVGHAELAHDLGPHVQCLAGGGPVRYPEARPVLRRGGGHRCHFLVSRGPAWLSGGCGCVEQLRLPGEGDPGTALVLCGDLRERRDRRFASPVTLQLGLHGDPGHRHHARLDHAPDGHVVCFGRDPAGGIGHDVPGSGCRRALP